MKRWAILTVLLYALALLLLTMPVILVAVTGDNDINVKDIAGIYQQWGYWLWLAVLVAGQALLLLLPLKIAEKKLTARRPLGIPVMVSAFFLANLLFAGLLDVFCALFREEGFGIFGYLTPFKTGQVQPSNNETDAGIIITILVFWFIWAAVFHRFARADEPEALLKRMTRWLLRGSILELLVAVPSHVIVRRRGDCCAPLGTFWGIAMGISVMLLCFGPGVFFLFVERFNRLKPKKTAGRPAQK